jgi:hypothetical protein
MEPALVILSFVFNDVYFKYLHKPTSRTMLGSEPSHRLHHFDTSTLPGSLLARSYLAHLSYFAGERLVRRLAGRPSFDFQIRGDFYLAWKDHGWDHTARLLGEMKHELSTRGIGFMVMVTPIRDQLEYESLKLDRDLVLYPQCRIAQVCRDLDIPLLDLTPTLLNDGDSQLYADFLHLAPAGNDVVAETLTQYLVDGDGRILMDRASEP